jgi:hypothetical protein
MIKGSVVVHTSNPSSRITILMPVWASKTLSQKTKQNKTKQRIEEKE